MLRKVTVTIITLNEEAHVRRAIESARWADEVLVVDSGSTDRTVEIARELGARVLSNPWRGYGQQKNFAQTQAGNDWVFSLDADEWISEALAREIAGKLTNPAKHGFDLPRRTYYLGQWIRFGGWYPNRLARLADRRHARWSEPEVHEALQVDGGTEPLVEALDHDAFASIRDQIQTNVRYSWLGSQELARRGQGPSIAKLVYKPLGKFLETFVLKRGFLDGLAGFIIAVNAAHSVFLKYAYGFEPRIRQRNRNGAT